MRQKGYGQLLENLLVSLIYLSLQLYWLVSFLKSTAIAPKTIIIMHVITYYLLIWGLPTIFNINMPINFIYIQGMLFIIEISIMLLIGIIRPLEKAFIFKPNAKIDMKPWKYTIPVTVILLGTIVLLIFCFHQ